MYVLIADDDAMLRDIVRRELHGVGIVAETVGTVADAELCLANQTFDVVILDINFPDGSGLDLLATFHNRAGGNSAQRAAIFFADDHVLGHVDETSRQVT